MSGGHDEDEMDGDTIVVEAGPAYNVHAWRTSENYGQQGIGLLPPHDGGAQGIPSPGSRSPLRKSTTTADASKVFTTGHSTVMAVKGLRGTGIMANSVRTSELVTPFSSSVKRV